MSLRICYNIYLPVRESPSHKAEMTSQILFGERFGITEAAGSWFKVVTLFDSFSGWIDSSQLLSSEWGTESKGIIVGREIKCLRPDNTQVRIMPGSEIYDLDFSTGLFPCQGEEWQLCDKPYENSLAPEGTLTETALQFLNMPYLWGGRTPCGFDCSGLIQTIFKIHGFPLPRKSARQAEYGETINFLEEAEPGDLIFFSDSSEEITHVGILISPGKILHASGSVRTDTVDHQGIWNEQTGKYTHSLRIIRRIKI